MERAEARKILIKYVKACREDDMPTLEKFEYEEILEAMSIGAASLSTLEPSEELEEAAENYAEKHGFRVPYDGSEKFYDETDVKASKDGFIAGAEWQRMKLFEE